MNHYKKSILGQAYIEYMVILAFVVFVLFAGNPSPIDSFINLVKEGFEKFSGFMSLPL